MAEIHGFCDERFAGVRDAFTANFDRGADIGASVAVYVDGEPVVDLWGGLADPETDRPWERDTITNIWSITKTMTALCALILADRGLIDFHAPVATYWPEFAAAGKENVEVRHVMGHTAGLPFWREPLEVADLYDWDKVTGLLAGQAPEWEPGTESGYHALTQGYLVGEIVRRVTGRTLGTFFREEVAEPLGADFHIGLPEEHDHRVSRVVPDMTMRTPGNPAVEPKVSWTPEWRRAEVPAGNGHGNARSVAHVQSVMACGGEARGVRLLSEKGCEAVFEAQSDGIDRVLGAPLRFGMGYTLPSAIVPLPPRSCFWGGWGGSVVVLDLDARMTVAYVMNRMQDGMLGDDRGVGILQGAFAAMRA